MTIVSKRPALEAPGAQPAPADPGQAARYRPATLLAGVRPLPGDPYHAASVPIYQTATFAQESARVDGIYDYTRSGNPTREAFERQVAALEGAEAALAYASGVAALAAVARLAQGGEILACDDLYGGTYRLLSTVLTGCGIAVRYVDATDLAAVVAALGENTRLLMVETPTNPLLRIADLAALAALAHREGALLAVDASLATPLRQRPLALGADLVVHSATKALCGHSDATAGIVAVRDPALAAELAFRRNAEGTALAPFESWLLLRGMKTLAVRLERQEENASRIAGFLARHPLVERVHFPGLADHPGAALHAAQSAGPGMVVSFETGSTARSERFVDALELFAIAVSFGGIGSTVSLPCRMSHASIPEEVRRARRLPDDLVRLSIGIEDADDLIGDLARALAASAEVPAQSPAKGPAGGG